MPKNKRPRNQRYDRFILSSLALVSAFFGTFGGILGTFAGQAWAGDSRADRDTLNQELRIAAREGRSTAVQSLLEAGADPDGRSEFGQTALMFAARYNQVRVVEILLEHGASTDARSDRDDTALTMAAQDCSTAGIERLLRAGADANARNYEGETALIYASAEGCVSSVRALLRAPGVQVNARNEVDKTALDLALEEAVTEVGGPFTETAQALRSAGGRTSRWTETPEKSLPQSPVSNSQKSPLPY